MTVVRGRAGTIVALGDSLTSGHRIGIARAYPAVLQALLDGRGYEYSVINAGVSGDTSAGAARRLHAALDRDDVRILIVALGANDGLRGVPVGQLEANLRGIIEEAARRGIAVVLCAMEAPPIYGWPYTTAFRDVYGQLAQRFKVPLVPFVMIRMIGNRDLLLPDALHPNEAGARLIADQIWTYLQPLLRRVA